ncbi:hypothetical protein ACMV_10300 [Acidiphilium multivorum AIU301]|uniref:Uncharacterized protein n=1 Tax=Acidiphilium multivorum (strain DSM 11245 / JCM 8867 / NBRC 100883 / AIU 301) TaxID=926570 RepID=F0J6C1_ACIMA|nr:hypothetical protein ACMV_10300 [Acidiphilium multivorum AIU301]
MVAPLVAQLVGRPGWKANRPILGEEGTKPDIHRKQVDRPAKLDQLFRRCQRAMLRFRRMRSLQKFASVHASVFNH